MTRRCCEILGIWTTIVNSKTWAGSATHMWTRCLRQKWPHSSLMIKHYRVQVGNLHRGYQSPCIRHALKKEFLLLEQFNQWLGVLGIHIEWRLQVSRPQNTSYICMTDLGWFQRKQNKPFSNSRRPLASSACELEEVSPFMQTYTSWTGHEGNAYKVSITSLMFNIIHGKDKDVVDGLNNNSSMFPHIWNPTTMWTRW